MSVPAQPRIWSMTAVARLDAYCSPRDGRRGYLMLLVPRFDA